MSLWPIYRIHQAEKGIVERWGEFKAVRDPGIHFSVPIMDSLVARIDMRENVIDVRCCTGRGSGEVNP